MGEGEDLLAAADRNMHRAWDAFVAHSPVPGRVEEPGLLLLSSGTPVPLFNPAFVTGPVPDPDEAAARVAAHYAALGSPFVLYFRDETAPGLAAAGLAAGMVEHWQPALMALDPIPEDGPPEPPGLTVRPVDAGSMDAYLDVLCAGFGLAHDLADAMLRRATLALDGFTAFLATVDGEPVATSGVYVAGAMAGVYNVATVPGARGKGYGGAVTRAAVRAGAAAGATRAVLQSSEAGEPVYRRLGFTTPARYRQLEAGPARP